MELPDVMLGDMFALLGEKDVKIFQLEKKINIMEAATGEAKASAKPGPLGPPFVKKADPFKEKK